MKCFDVRCQTKGMASLAGLVRLCLFYLSSERVAICRTNIVPQRNDSFSACNSSYHLSTWTERFDFSFSLCMHTAVHDSNR